MVNPTKENNMGLDMYIKRDADHEEIYWRKANAIHGWFERKLASKEEELENCKSYPITKELVTELLETVEEVLTKRELELASTKLPTMSGFFFGTTEYDNNYWGDLEYTKEQLLRLLDRWDSASCYYYYAWW